MVLERVGKYYITDRYSRPVTVIKTILSNDATFRFLTVVPHQSDADSILNGGTRRR